MHGQQTNETSTKATDHATHRSLFKRLAIGVFLLAIAILEIIAASKPSMIHYLAAIALILAAIALILAAIALILAAVRYIKLRRSDDLQARVSSEESDAVADILAKLAKPYTAPPQTYLANQVAKMTISRQEGLDLEKLLEKPLRGLLPEPYDLVFEWAKYVPLESLLKLHFAANGIYRNNKDGTATMLWEALGAGQPTVPLALVHKTIAREMTLWNGLSKPSIRKSLAHRDSKIFLDHGRPVTPAMVRNAMERALRN